MKKYSDLAVTTSLMAAMFLISACDVKVTTPDTKFKMPEIKIPDIDMNKMNAMFKTCDRKDSEMVFSEEALKNRLIVKDKIESSGIEYVDCDGKVVETGSGPIRSLKKTVIVPPPSNIFEPIVYVRVANARTCAVKNVSTKENALESGSVEEITLPDGEKIKIPNSSVSNPSGHMRLSLTDATVKLVPELNVQDGNNVLQIQYFGACLKYKAEKDQTKGAGDITNCLESKLLATRDFILEAHILRPEANGTRRVSRCPKK